ncbi:response regulator transcription factor [Sutterella sp.]|uniref:response regulator transcription factor n=1 Tax=Sutterella sp. TaxID=1981025 RepID=UPI0026DF27CE|nr:response regulator transcription factor [Sutterella sp.]MDO5530766.1 response regulator transcription factor [Sutterella sp.]
MALRLLVVDDNADIRENLRDYLELRGYAVSTAADALTAGHLLETEGADLVILDIGLPGVDGMTFCRELRRGRDQTPVLMLTARDTVDDRVEGLTAGADDYLVKPFALRELAARVEALLRRAHRGDTEKLVLGGLVLDLSAMSVTRDGEPVKVNPTGLRILRVLMEASPRIVSRAELENRIWGDEPPASDSLRSNLHLVRQAVDRPFGRPMIQTHPGYGWSIREPGEA